MKNKYFVASIQDVNSVGKLRIRYGIFRRDDNQEVLIESLMFSSKDYVQRVCDYLNECIDKDIERMFHNGVIMPYPPFNFLDAWNDRCESAIKKRFERWKNHHREFIIKCHFDSDLLVLSNVPSELDAFKVCQILDIPYESYFGANTFCSEDIILNVGKVKTYFRERGN